MSIPSTLDHLDGIVDALATTGMTVYRTDVPGSAAAPYAFAVWPGGSRLDGPVGAPDSDGELIAQVTYVGAGSEQADHLRDRGRSVLLGVDTVQVPGRRVWRVLLDVEAPSQVDHDVNPPAYYSVDRYRLMTSPSGAPL